MVKLAPKPRSEEEYIMWLRNYLSTWGRTSLRKLGDAVQRPKGFRSHRLKATLLRHRTHFVIDLQNCVDINHARRWRWQSQAFVAKQRVRAVGLHDSTGFDETI